MLGAESRGGRGKGTNLDGEGPARQGRVTRLATFCRQRCGRRRPPSGTADGSTVLPRCCERGRQSDADPLNLQKHMHALLVQTATGECNQTDIESAAR